MLNINDIWRYYGDRPVLSGTTFSVDDGAMVGLIGPSGGGKSVLLKIIGQILKAHSGSVRFCDQEEFRFSLMFQEGALFDSLTVLDNVAFPLVNGMVPYTLLPKARRHEVEDKVLEVLGKVGLAHAANKMPGQLSGGMRRRVSLARALVARPKLLLLDDPTSGLDPVASSVIMNLIREVHAENRPTLIMVSHDLRRLFPAVDRLYALFDGKISFSGTVDELRDNACPMLRRFVTARYDFAEPVAA